MARPLEVTKETCYRINRPEWYSDPGWLAWLNSGNAATWHKPGQKANEYCDVFFWYDQGEGSDWPNDYGNAIPDYIWDEICSVLKNTSGIVWVTNLAVF